MRISNNMNKEIKTILFASLIAAMILPFSSMDFAVAEKTCIELIQEDHQRKTDNIDKKLIKQLAKETKEFKKLVSDRKLNDVGVIYEGQSNTTDCTSELTNITQTYQYVDSDKKAKKLSVTFDAKDKKVKQTSIKEDKQISFTFLGTQTGNWAGHSVRDHSGSSEIDRTLMYWDVPTAQDPSGLNCGTTANTECHIAIWTGLTDKNDGSDVMSQLGTDSICSGNNCTSTDYFAWIQFWDNGSMQGSTECPTTTVNAGDSMYASMQYITSGTDRYYGYLYNLENGNNCSGDRNETENPVYGQFIGERPQVGGSDTVLAKFTDFSIRGYFYDSGVLKGLDDIDTSGYDRYANIINTVANPYADANQPNSSDIFTLNYIKSN